VIDSGKDDHQGTDSIQKHSFNDRKSHLGESLTLESFPYHVTRFPHLSSK
jgi:hypothetical protein